MSTQDLLRDIDTLRLSIRMNNRLRLEILAALSRLFREYDIAVTDNILRSLTVAIPQELPGESGYKGVALRSGTISESTKQTPCLSTQITENDLDADYF